MHDAAVVQVRKPFGDLSDEESGLFRAKAVGFGNQHVTQRRAGAILHNYDVLARGVLLDVEDRDKVGALEVDAMADAAKLNLGVVPKVLQRHLTTPVAYGVVHFTESTATYGALNRIVLERSVTVFIRVGHFFA